MDERPPEGLFSASELKLFRYTSVLAAAVLMTGLAVLVIWVLGKLISVFYSLLLPLSVAGVMALMLYPVVDFLKQRLGFSHAAAVWTLLLSASAAIVAGVAFVLPSAIDQAVKLWRSVPEIASHINDSLSYQFPGLWDMVLSRIEEWEPEDAEGVDAGVAERVMSYVSVLFGLATVPFFLFFALLSGRGLREQAKGLLTVFHTDTQKEILYLVEVFVSLVTTFFQGQFIIALIMGVMFATGFTLIGLPASIAVGFALGALNIVPYLGTILGLLIVIPLAWVQPGAGSDLVLLALLVFAIVQLVENWVLTPKIMGDRSGLHPAVVIISLFFWGTALNGVIGMILAVPLTAFIVALWRHMRMRLAQQLVSQRFELPGDDATQETADSQIQVPQGRDVS